MKLAFRCLPFLLLFIGLHAHAQLEVGKAIAVRGKLFVSVDDAAQILVNGAEFHRAPLNESETPELELKPGDRIVVKLKNTLGKGRFMLLFVSDDRKQMVSFTPSTFRILPDPRANDFTAVEFANFRKQARPVTGSFGKPYMLPFKSASKWVWGDVDICSIGCLITPELFRPNTRE